MRSGRTRKKRAKVLLFFHIRKYFRQKMQKFTKKVRRDALFYNYDRSTEPQWRKSISAKSGIQSRQWRFV